VSLLRNSPDRTLGALFLQRSEFRLNLMMAQGGESQEKGADGLISVSLVEKDTEPRALIEFILAGGSTNDGGSDRVCMEFNHDELYSFFLQLENIQHEHLDKLY
jgi:hypothetical protein